MSTDTLYSLLYLEINLFSIALIIIIRIKTLGLSKMVAQRNFSSACDIMVVFFLSDALWVLVGNRFLPYTRFAVLALKDIYFLSTSALCFAWFIYFEFLQDSPMVKNGKRILISSVFVWLQLLSIIINHIHPIMYYVDENNIYTRLPFFLCLYGFSYVYIIVTCLRAFISALDKSRPLSERTRLFRLAPFPILPAIGGLIQFRIPGLPVVCGMVSLATLLLYLDWTTELISVDPLTKLNNRKQLLHSYEQWTKNNDVPVPIHFLMIDANRFKEINDNYGHVEGDAALVRIADALRYGCKNIKHRPNIARYGGDEFVIMVKEESDDTIQNMIERITDQLKNLNTEANAPYPLTVSFGLAKTTATEGISLKELAARADAELYKAKELLKKASD